MNESPQADEIRFDIPPADSVRLILRGLPESVVFVDPIEIAIQTIRILIVVKVNNISRLKI